MRQIDGFSMRKATVQDADDICSIYNYYVLNTAITFETCSSNSFIKTFQAELKS